MKVLVTGASGFVGPFLVKELIEHGHEPIGLGTTPVGDRLGDIDYHIADLRDEKQLRKIVAECMPESIVHLAAFSNQGMSYDHTEKVIDVNVLGTLNLCKAAVRCARTSTLLMVSSGMVYGRPMGSMPQGFDERSPVRPESPYAMSKLAAEYTARCFNSETFRVLVARPFNHTGPYQTPDFVCAAFAKRIKAAKDGDDIHVGSLDAIRDFTDVRDIARAYRLMIERKPVEDLLVLGSGHGVSIGEVFEDICRLSGKRLKPIAQASLTQKHDGNRIVSNPEVAKRVLNWQPEIPFTKTLADLYQSI